MAKIEYPTLNEVRQLLDYNSASGVFLWKLRSSEMFADNRTRKNWNTKYAGKRAGSRHPSGYLFIRLYGKNYAAHILAWIYVYGETPLLTLDHINGIGTDNRLNNLRLATGSQNQANKKASWNNTSGAKGVILTKSGTYAARIGYKGKDKHIGTYNSLEKAKAAYEQAARKLFGEFARAE